MAQTLEIQRPPIEAPLHGLLDTAYEIDISAVSESDREKWESAISFFPNPVSCHPVTPWVPGCDDPQDKSEGGVNTPFSEFRTIVLTYSTVCHVVPGDLDANVDAAMDALRVGSGQAIESVLWGPHTGGILDDLYGDGGNFSLSGSTPLVTGYDAGSCNGILNQNALGSNAVAHTPKQALLALTQALGNCAIGARGFIHAPVYLAEDWAGQDLAKPSDPKDPASKLITNVRGDYVVGGSGYSGAGPVGHPLATPAEGHAWAYATGPVGVLLGEPTAKEATLIDHRTNLHRIIVERPAAIAANSLCIFAVYVDVA